LFKKNYRFASIQLSKSQLELIGIKSTSQSMSLQTHEYDFAADALFLDFDGTLVNLAPEPGSVVPAWGFCR